MKLSLLALLAVGFGAVLVAGGAFFTVDQTEVVILTQFGAPVGEPITTPGLHWKTPFVQDVNRLEKRVLEWDGPPTEMSTKEKKYIKVDTFARWRISDPTQFFVALRDVRSALSRLDDIIGSEVRTSIASHDLIELIRTDKNRELPPDLQNLGATPSVVPKATRGRLELERDILRESAPKCLPLGIELLDVRVKRVNYNSGVLDSIYQRMKSERAQIAAHFRSEGEGEAARINGKKERDLREVESEAYKKVQQLRGEADAEASRIYAEAYDKSPEAREFYTFMKTLETWRAVLGKQTSLILSTKSDLFRMLEKSGR